jgi:hypothetical protein
MAFRIYVDESGTHSPEWLVIGMLFVPDHGPLHSDLIRVKEDREYFNRKPKRKARYKETHLTEFRSERDVLVARDWIDLFIKHDCYFRSVVIDWSIWNGSYFGDPFEPADLKKRRAYKKWAEMPLHPELKEPLGSERIKNAKLYLDRLRIMYGYDVIDHLRDRFTHGYEGATPYISEFQHTESWKDANQCLQLCDILTGCQYQALNPAASRHKQASWRHLESALRPCGVDRLDAGYWRQYSGGSLRTKCPKYSAWFWKPTPQGKKKGVKKRGRRR